MTDAVFKAMFNQEHLHITQQQREKLFDKQIRGRRKLKKETGNNKGPMTGRAFN